MPKDALIGVVALPVASTEAPCRPTGGPAGTVARVLADFPAIDRELDYLVPAELAMEIQVGSIVRVPLQGRRVRAWVVAYPVVAAEGVVLRPIAKVTGLGPQAELLDLASWAAWRWAGRRRSLLVTASPQRAVRYLPAPTKKGGPAMPLPGRLGPRAAAARALVERALGLGRGTHLLQLPPDYDSTELVAAAAARGPVLVMVPSEERVVAGSAALRRRGLAVAQLPSEWAQARAGADVVIGTRGAAWGPCAGMASAVVLDAHDEGLVQGTTPTWDGASVMAERASRAGAPCLWVSACPTLDMLAAGPYLHLPSQSESRAGWAALQVVDTRGEDPRHGLYSDALVKMLRQGGRAVCVLNRKGRATLLACDACREVARCEVCGGAVALVDGQLRCRRCGTSRPEVCANCGSDAVRLLRVGVSTVAEQVSALVGRAVPEVTSATAAVPDAQVVVGTEAVLYRERELRATGGVDAVAFLDFDQELLAPRYRAGEEALALLARASRLVGGRRRGGRVLVQTRLPGHPVLRAALLGDPGVLAAAEEPVRRALRLPPFYALGLLSGPGAPALAQELAGRSSEVDVAGPDSAGRFFVRAPDNAALADVLASARRPRDRVRVEVGPVRI
ncbi:MAG: hypothetical protein ACP5VR_03310 [Acidimicrobiales bacterium]